MQFLELDQRTGKAAYQCGCLLPTPIAEIYSDGFFDVPDAELDSKLERYTSRDDERGCSVR